MRKLLLFVSCLLSAAAHSQNVGIGTNVPLTRLDINGALSERITDYAPGATISVGANIGVVRITANATTPQANAITVASPQVGQFLTVINEDNDAATLNGYTIPAGSASTPSVADFLYVGGAVPGWKRTSDNNTGSTSFTAGNGLSWSGTTLNSVWTANGTNDIHNNNGSTKVGIGTAGTVPVQKLEVNGNTVLHNGGTTYNNAGSGELHIGFSQAASGSAGETSRLALQPYGHTGGPFRFVTRDDATKAYLDMRYGTTNGITLNSDGNVGIGNTAPGVKLDVTGAVRTNNQFISTVATGTAPIAVSSTTLATNLNADLLDGRHLSEIEFQQSNRDFPNGTLIQSDIDYSVTSGDPWLLEIEGNSYGQIVPIDIKIQGYIYYDSLINVGGISNGTGITGLSAFNYGGKLCFWFPYQAYWNGYSVYINDSYQGVKRNRLVSITHVAKPGGVTKEVALTPKIRQSWHSGNFTPGSYSAGVGTPNRVVKFVTASTIGDSKIIDDGVNTINANSRWFQVNSKEVIDGNDAWLRINQSGAYANGIYTPGFFRADGGIASGGVSAPAGIVNAATGYRVNSAAANGSYLRGNGTNYVSSTIQASDVPTLNQNTTGYATYLKSPYPYNINITDATTAATLCEPASLTSVNMHASHGLFSNWATTLTMSGYDRYGAYQISGNYNNATPELAIRNYVQSTSTWNSWVKLITTANIGSYGDNLGNHTATTTLNMNGRTIASTADIFSDQNYGLGLVGVYSPTRYQNVWSMGGSYRLPADGSTPGNLYGIAFAYNPDYGGAGNNAQAKAGLNHQALFMMNGVTYSAIGNGMWTSGNIRFGNYLLGNDKYAIDATDGWLRLNQQGSFGGTYSPYLIRSDGGFDVDALQVIDADAGWHRTYGATGWYNGTYAGGWYMTDATWIRNYNQKRMYFDTDAGDNTETVRTDAQSGTQDHALTCESDAWGYVGFSNQRWYAMYAWAGFGTSSLKHKTDVHELTGAEIDKSLDDVNKIQSITYKWNKAVWEKMNGNFADNKLHEAGEKPDPNYQVPSWLGFSVESLPEGIVDETGENYQYGAMLGLLVSSTKALTKRTEILANALEIDFEKLKTAKSVTKNISDFGTASTNARETWINFSDEFIHQLNGNTPSVTISSSQAGVTLSVTEKSSKGFKVVSSSDKPVDFDYIAMGKTVIEFPDYASTVEKPMEKADINAWYADFSKKNKTLPQQVGNPAEEALKKQQKPSLDPALKGTYVEPDKIVPPPTSDPAPSKEDIVPDNGNRK